MAVDVVRRGLAAVGSGRERLAPGARRGRRRRSSSSGRALGRPDAARRHLRWSTVWRRALAADRLPAPGRRGHARLPAAPPGRRGARAGGPRRRDRDPARRPPARRATRRHPLGPTPTCPAATCCAGSTGWPRCRSRRAPSPSAWCRCSASSRAPPVPPQAPRASRDWAARAAARLADDLPGLATLCTATRRCCPRPSRRTSAVRCRAVDPDHTLDVALAACLARCATDDPHRPSDLADPIEGRHRRDAGRAPARDPPRRRPQDRHLVRAGHLVQPPRRAARAGPALPRRPPRRPLPGGAGPDGPALGRPGARGRRRLGPARRPGPRLAGHRDHQPRDPRHRLARPRRPGAGVPRRWPGRRPEIHVVLSARDLVRQIPAEWQENVKHRRTKTYADFLADLRDPRARHPGGAVVLGGPGGARRARPLGLDAPGRAGAPGHRAAARCQPDPAVGAVRRGCSASTRPPSRPRTEPTPRSGCPSRR